MQDAAYAMDEPASPESPFAAEEEVLRERETNELKEINKAYREALGYTNSSDESTDEEDAVLSSEDKAFLTKKGSYGLPSRFRPITSLREVDGLSLPAPRPISSSEWLSNRDVAPHGQSHVLNVNLVPDRHRTYEPDEDVRCQACGCNQSWCICCEICHLPVCDPEVHKRVPNQCSWTHSDIDSLFTSASCNTNPQRISEDGYSEALLEVPRTNTDDAPEGNHSDDASTAERVWLEPDPENFFYDPSIINPLYAINPLVVHERRQGLEPQASSEMREPGEEPKPNCTCDTPGLSSLDSFEIDEVGLRGETPSWQSFESTPRMRDRYEFRHDPSNPWSGGWSDENPSVEPGSVDPSIRGPSQDTN